MPGNSFLSFMTSMPALAERLSRGGGGLSPLKHHSALGSCRPMPWYSGRVLTAPHDVCVCAHPWVIAVSGSPRRGNTLTTNPTLPCVMTQASEPLRVSARGGVWWGNPLANGQYSFGVAKLRTRPSVPPKVLGSCRESAHGIYGMLTCHHRSTDSGVSGLNVQSKSFSCAPLTGAMPLLAMELP